MSIHYNSKKIIPAPLVSITKDFEKSGDGQKQGSSYTLTVQGTIVAFKGSPDSAGTFWTTSGYPDDETIATDSRLASILNKQAAILDLFSEDGHSFEIQPWDGSSPTKCNPEVISVVFPEGTWHDTCPYTITLKAPRLMGPLNPDGEDSFTDYITQATEDWTIEFNDQPESVLVPQTFRLTHSLSAVGKLFYEPDGSLTYQPWEQAKNWVQARLGLDIARARANGVLNLPNYFTGFNHTRTENVGKLEGQYGVTETWIISSGNVLEDFTISVTESAEDGLVRVSIDGNIVGLDTRDTGTFQLTTSKWAAASGRYATVEGQLLTRAMNYSNYSLNILPLSKVVRRNPTVGNIGYTVDYDNRPGNCIAGVKSETISITDHNPGDVFAVIPVLGRAAGPVLQDISTIRESKRDLSYECVVPTTGTCTIALLTAGKPDITSVVNLVVPTTTQVFKESDVENWSPKQGRYSRQITWVYQ
jgi:hypothetical protein